jgi:general secretion pathway protein D
MSDLRFMRIRKINGIIVCGLLFCCSHVFAQCEDSVRSVVRDELMEDVACAWRLPDGGSDAISPNVVSFAGDGLIEKLNAIVIPKIAFTQMPLSHAIQCLSELSVEFDLSNTGKKGVNIVLVDPENKDPKVTMLLRDVSLERVLSLVTQSVGYQYDLENGVVAIRPYEGKGRQQLQTAFFPITRATAIQLGGGVSDNSEFAIKAFFQRAGTDFQTVEGASLAFDGAQVIVTQTPRNLERIRNILKRYNTVKQVEIEAKFLEVQEGVLEELGFQWNVSYGDSSIKTYEPAHNQQILRSLSTSFTPKGLTAGDGFMSVSNPITGGSGSTIRIPNQPPVQPNAINIGSTANNFANIVGIGDKLRVSAIIRALEQHTGTDLMSAPKVTVLSGKTAEIVVAQELRYPSSYGDIDSSVGSASLGASSAGVTITAGTPQDFKTERVGVQMQVTPTVEEDNKSISLCLEPKVTEFEGFVEYGGMSVAIAGNTKVNVPSGFFQPIFSIRQIRTEVTIQNGATVVMGGLTREEVKAVKDKVPFLGDLPGIGRLFRSKGETSQKRNLLIFVTASLVPSA